ncbi:MAG: PLP-dependent lyase/thiolase [Candidatus Bathyarchaeia archaeon]
MAEMSNSFLLHPEAWRTPLIKLPLESERVGCEVYAKLETVNPTGVHKDRESAMVIRDMIKKGYREVACASSGNAAISISGFAYMHGFESHVFLGSDTPEEKLHLLKIFQPSIHKVRGDYLDAVDALLEFIDGKNVYNANAGYCEAKLIGNSYIGEEIARDLKPDYVVCPTSNGTHFVGVGMGILRSGLKPELIAATAPETRIAHSIKGFYHLEEPKITELITATSGCIVEVSDSEIFEATRRLVKQGIVAEPASAASIAAIPHLNPDKGEVVCSTITGNGLKYPNILREILSKS